MEIKDMTGKPQQVIPVVAACIVQSGCVGKLVLLSKRLTAKEPSTLGKWEFPGGAVHSGETFEDALKREIKEELRLQVLPKKLLHAQINTYDSGTHYSVLYYECDLIGKVEYFVDELRWVSPWGVAAGEWNTLPGTVEAVKKFLGEK